MKFIEIQKYLNKLYPLEKSFSWDNDGVEVCWEEEAEVKNILLCLDVTSNVAAYAINNNKHLIISHHPLLYSPVKKLTNSNVEMTTALTLYKNNISLMSFHTRLDAARDGVNDMFIKAIKLNCEKIITNFGNAENDAIGRIVELKETRSTSELAVHIKDNLSQTLAEANFNTYFGIKYIDSRRPVKKIAVVAGSGLMFLDNALSVCDIDTFITGEAGYNKLISAAGRNLNFILCNHFESEAIVLPMLKSLIESQFEDLKVEIHTENIIKELW